MPDDIPAAARLRDGEALRVVVHDSLQALDALRPAWNALLEETDQRSAAQTFEYAATAWRLLPKTPGAGLRVIAASTPGGLVAVWPLHVEVRGGLRIARHLGSSSDEEYAGPIMARGPGEQVAARAMLDAAKALADVLKVYNLRPGSAMARALDADKALKHRGRVRSPVIEAPLRQSWETWLASRSGRFRAELRHDRRRLEQLGQVRFEDITDPAEIDAAVAWTFEVKRRSLIAHGVSASWVFQPTSLAFLQDAVRAAPGVHIQALKLDDRIAAAAIMFYSPGLAEYYMAAYDHDLHHCSPGLLLLEDLVRLCFAERRAFDFRITAESYKQRWVDGSQAYDSYLVATSLRGVPPVLDHMRGRAVVRSKIAVKAWAKRLMARRRAGKM